MNKPQIVTTNWDTYFEEECAATPFVHGEDFTFSDLPDRKVYKIHGSITSLASLVATQDDYTQRLEDLRINALGGRLRDLLATRTVIFIGYSLRDWNFRELYEALLSDMGAFRPRAFVVSPFPNEAAEELGLKYIKTSGYAFLESLKESLAGHNYLPDRVYEVVADWLEELVDAHDELLALSHREYPSLAYSISYQDGLIHAFRRVLNRRPSGEYSDRHHIHDMAHSYGEIMELNMDSGEWFEAAYADGYGNAIVSLLVAVYPDMVHENFQAEAGDSSPTIHGAEKSSSSGGDKRPGSAESDETTKEIDPEIPPLWMIFGQDGPEYVDSVEELVEALKVADSVNAEAHRSAIQLTSEVNEDLIISHRPFLRGSQEMNL